MKDMEPRAQGVPRIDLAREADFALGAARVSPSTLEVTVGPARHVLQPRVMQVLVALARRKGEVVSRDELSKSCWEGLSVSEDAINRCISQLRRLSEESGGGHFAIETVARVGYRLTETMIAETRSPEVMGLGTAAASLPTIAVLPFLNLSPDSEQEYFSDGLSEELINQLAQIKSLRVAGRTSSFAFKGKTEDLRSVGQKLGVRHVLEGSVRKAGNRLRIAVQLIDCHNGYHLWSDTFERELSDVFAIQEDVARAVAYALGVTLGVGKTRQAGGTNDLVAYDLYLRARALQRQAQPADLVRSAELYREALNLDPKFVLACAGLTEALILHTIYVPEASARARAELDQVVEHVLTLAPHFWATQWAFGCREEINHRWVSAEKAFARALELAPASEPEPAFRLGSVSASVGFTHESIEYLAVARQRDPLWLLGSAMLQIGLCIAGRNEEADAEYKRGKDLPGDHEASEHVALFQLWRRGDSAAVKVQFDRFLAHESVRTPVLCEIAEVLDQPEAVRAKLRQAFDDPGHQDATRQMKIAAWAAHYDDNDLALAVARRSFVDLKGRLIYVIWLPVFGAVRRDPRFKDLVRDIGLVDYWRSTGKWGDFARPVGNDDFEIIR